MALWQRIKRAFISEIPLDPFKGFNSDDTVAVIIANTLTVGLFLASCYILIFLSTYISNLFFDPQESASQIAFFGMLISFIVLIIYQVFMFAGRAYRKRRCYECVRNAFIHAMVIGTLLVFIFSKPNSSEEISVDWIKLIVNAMMFSGLISSVCMLHLINKIEKYL